MMNHSYYFYIARARDAATAARAAKLDNVRDRELRAEKTWLGLAEQARKVVIQREKTAREKESQRRAEADERERIEELAISPFGPTARPTD